MSKLLYPPEASIRIGILGAGRVAQHYRQIFDSGVVTGFEIVGISDIDYDAARSLAVRWQCPVFDTLASMVCLARPDLVFILTPSGMHYRHASEALSFGCHVHVEKPVCLLPSEARDLSRLSKEKNRMLGVAFQNRLNPAIICLRDALQKGRFGQITTATIRLRWCRYQEYYQDAWHGTWAQDGGVINQQAIHHLDALNWLLGSVEAVCATMSNRLNILQAEDTLVGLIKFSNGALGTIEATTAARPRDFEASLSIVGECGMATIGGIALNTIETWQFVDPISDDTEAPMLWSRDVPNGYGLSHGPLINLTLERLRQGSLNAPITVEDCIHTTELVHALYASCETNNWVLLSDRPLSSRLGKS